MPTLPPRNQPQQPQRPHGNKAPGNGVNKKALVIFGVVVVGVIVMISVGTCRSNSNVDTEPDYTVSSSEPEIPDVVSSTPPPEPPAPEENSGTEIPLVSGAIYRDSDKFVLASDIMYSETKSVADVSTISLNEYLTVKPNAACTYNFEPNTLIMTHNTGSLISLTRAKYASTETLHVEEFDPILAEHATANGVENPYYGNIYLGTVLRGRYVTGTVTPAGDTESKTFLLCYFYGDPEIYTMTALYNSDDAFNLLLNSISWNKNAIQLN